MAVALVKEQECLLGEHLFLAHARDDAVVHAVPAVADAHIRDVVAAREVALVLDDAVEAHRRTLLERGGAAELREVADRLARLAREGGEVEP